MVPAAGDWVTHLTQGRLSACVFFLSPMKTRLISVMQQPVHKNQNHQEELERASGEFSQLGQAGRVLWGTVQTLLNWELGNLPATLLNRQSIHTKKDSIMHELTPTTAPGPAATLPADISGKEVNSIALSVGFPQGLPPVQLIRLQRRPKCPSRGVRKACSCSQLPAEADVVSSGKRSLVLALSS